MSKIERQQDANQASEAVIFYPTGHIVACFANADDAKAAQKH